MRAAICLTIIGLTLAAVATPLAAQHRPVKEHKVKVKVVHPRNRVVFRTNDRVIFRNYYRTHRIVITPLRPEVARLVVIGKPLPVEIVRVGVPQELLVQLAPAPAGYRYLIAGDRVVILDDQGYVSDILVDVFEVRP